MTEAKRHGVVQQSGIPGTRPTPTPTPTRPTPTRTRTTPTR